jgi:multiple sugar transport system permease protein
LSFYTWHADPSLRTFVGFQHYDTLWNDAKFLQALTNMGKYFIIAVPGQVLAGLAVALLLHSVRIGRSLFRTIYFFPYITPAVAISWAWSLILSPHLGIANVILRALGLPAQAFLTSPHQALPTVAFIVIWQYLGFHAVLFLVALNTIPRELYEAARIDGASGWHLFRFITLPLINPTLVLSIIMATGSPSIGILQLFTQVINLRFYDPGGPIGSTSTIVLYMYQAGFRRFDLGYAAAMAVILFTIIVAITAVQFHITRRRLT